jgi:hypothetical protein
MSFFFWRIFTSNDIIRPLCNVADTDIFLRIRRLLFSLIGSGSYCLRLHYWYVTGADAVVVFSQSLSLYSEEVQKVKVFVLLARQP